MLSIERRLATVAQAWSLELGEPYQRDSHGIVLRVWTGRTPAVLKVGIEALPWPTAQIPTLLAANGRGYVRVLEYDESLGAVLLEQLGPSAEVDGHPPVQQATMIAEVLGEAWRVPVEVGPPRFDKAQTLMELTERLATPDDRSRWGVALDRAALWAEELSTSADPGRDVLCHGDPHPGNLLRSISRTPTTPYVFIDPDGIRCEPEYDVGVVLRSWAADLLAANEPQEFLAGIRDTVCEITGADVERAWKWGFVERVTTGLVVRHLGEVSEAEEYLDSAMKLT